MPAGEYELRAQKPDESSLLRREDGAVFPVVSPVSCPLLAFPVVINLLSPVSCPRLAFPVVSPVSCPRLTFPVVSPVSCPRLAF